ncbi:hemin ABC transporter [Mannheimia granulomatis]|uniref:Leukotoxin translocation ATP-binding protein LktB n=1 Tax=Mannheimia granulomatis TaxID=85402 RepID=A0A6G8JFN1_9PAST|nr:ATP-binding cassette domain-containing protein [Mannheimia granulomatis]QIM65937.1 hemin ABC transporter [Mannheimia granulomatis]
MTNLLSCQNLSVYHQQKRLLHIPSTTFEQAKFTTILGPNGAGKTTLLKALSGNNVSTNNAVFYKNQSLKNLAGNLLAQKRAILSQQSQIAFPLKVKELVQLGREPYRNSEFAKFNENMTAWAIEAMSLTELQDRSSTQLSGGEQHRAHISRVLAQLLPEPNADLTGKWLLLDEPTNHLDIHHQYQLFALLQNLKQQGLTIIAILHDPALAINQSDRILMLKNGEKFAEGAAKEVAESSLLDELYQMKMGCRYCPYTEQYYLSPKSA